jgi:hypothetical protein
MAVFAAGFIALNAQSDVMFTVKYAENINTAREDNLFIKDNNKETYQIKRIGNWKSNWKSCEIEHKQGDQLLTGIAHCKTNDGAIATISCMKFTKSSGLEDESNNTGQFTLKNDVKNRNELFLAISLTCFEPIK